MKMTSAAIGAVLAAVAVPAFAQVYYDRNYDRNYDPYYARGDVPRGTECWNPRAGHYESVRPGEFQNDLDMGRCRVYGGARMAERRYYRGGRQECWNPGAGHFEEMRPGEYQNDLDLAHCRPADRYAYGR